MNTRFSRFGRIHALMQAHHFGAAPSARLSFSTPFAFYEGEGGGGEAPKTFTQAEVDAQIAGLKQKNEQLLGTIKTLKPRADVLGERTAEEVAADLEYARTQREADAKKKGEYELLTKQMSDQHATEKKKLEERLMSVQTGRLNDHKKRVLAEEISTAKGKVKKLLDPIGKYVKVVELEDGSLSEQVVDDKGNVRIVDGQGTPMTVTQLIAQFSEDPDYMVDFEPSGTTGSGARNEGTPAGKGGVIIVPKGVEAQEYRRLKDEATKTGKVLKFAS